MQQRRDVAETSPSFQEPSLVDVVRRYWWLILLCLVWAVASAVLYTYLRTPDYLATASLVVEDPQASSIFDAPQAGETSERYVADQVEILRSPAVAERAAQIVEEEAPSIELTAEAIISQARYSASGETGLILISFRAADPVVAQVGANAIGSAYREVRRAEAQENYQAALERIDSALQSLDGDLAAIKGQINALRSAEGPRNELEAQVDAAIAEIVELQNELGATTDPARREEILNRLAELRRQLETIQLAISIPEQEPELLALLQEQEALIARRSELAARRTEVEIDAQLQSDGVLLFSPAPEPSLARGSGLRRALAVALVLGGLVGVGLAYVLALRRRTFSGRFQPEAVLGAPMLAEIPDFSHEGLGTPLPVRDSPRTATAEAFRFAAAAIDVQVAADHQKVLAIASAVVGEGKTTVAANTALAAAREGARVLVVDADLGDQALARIFGQNSSHTPGLTDLVEGGVEARRAFRQVSSAQGTSLTLLGKGTRRVNPADFFRSAEVGELFAGFRDQFDLILLDIPPVLQVAYASTLLRYADAALVIVCHGGDVTRIEEVSDRLRFLGTPVAGYLYNRAPLRAEMTATEGSMKGVLGEAEQDEQAAAGLVRRLGSWAGSARRP